MMDRREFFKRACALTGTLILPAGCSQDGAGLLNAPSNAPLAFSQLSFEDSIDTVFSVTHETFGIVDLNLTGVTNELFIPEADQFSALLAGPEQPVLEEDTYAVYNDNFGDISLYIQPGATGGGQQHYVVAFSLLNS